MSGNGEKVHSGFRRYIRKTITSEMRPYRLGESTRYISISFADRGLGCPKPGDMIARNPDNHNDQWLIEGKYFLEHFEDRPFDAALSEEG